MKITGDDLVKMFYTSMTEDIMVETIDALGLEQPLLDEEYDFYKSVSTENPKNIGIDFTFSECTECEDKTIPCLDVISWDSDKNIEAPFGLNFTLSYAECCKILNKKADYLNKRIKDLKIWIITYNNKKYKIAIMFENMDFMEIRSIVISPYTQVSIKDSYIPNKD